jgi:hypothetical protein
MVMWPAIAIVWTVVDGLPLDATDWLIVCLGSVPGILGVHQLWFNSIEVGGGYLRRERFFGLERTQVPLGSCEVGLGEPDDIGYQAILIAWAGGVMRFHPGYPKSRRFPEITRPTLVSLLRRLHLEGVSIEDGVWHKLGFEAPDPLTT